MQPELYQTRSIHRGLGYRRTYGETTKHAGEAPVFSRTTLVTEWIGGMWCELAGLYVSGWWLRRTLPMMGVPHCHHPEPPGVEHATYRVHRLGTGTWEPAIFRP